MNKPAVKMHLLETENVGDMNGLLEILEDIGKTVDIATLDDSLDEERSTLLNLLNDAEALGFVDVSKGEVTLKPMGKKYVTAEVDKRKSILKSILANVEPFYSVIKTMKESRDAKMSMEDLQNLTGDMFPSDDPESIVKILMNWGRYARLIDFDSDEDEFSISS